MIRRNPILPAFAVATFLLAAAPSRAQFPVQDMGARSLGLGYSFLLRGQDITNAETASNEVQHLLALGYAPIPYLLVEAAIGMDRLSVGPESARRFRGDYGLATGLGASGFSPFFAADLMRATGGVKILGFASEDSRGYRYSAVVANPFLGIILSPSRYLDVTLGARAHLMDGEMKSPRETGGGAFANPNVGRGYLALAFKTPFEGAYLNLDLDFSPQFDTDWSDGPREAAIGISLGAILDWRGKSEPTGAKPTYFPSYPEMKDRQKKMAEELE